MQIERSKNYLHRINDELPRGKALLNSYQKVSTAKLEILVSRFKSNNIRAVIIIKTIPS
jgi:hypothetical protein